MFKTENKLLLLLLLPFFIWAESGDFNYSKIIGYQPVSDTADIHVGLDLLIEHDFRLIKGKDVAIVCNTGSVTRNGAHILDIIESRDDFNLVSIIQVSEKAFDTQSSGMVWMQTDSSRNINNVTITPANPEVKRADLNGAKLILFDVQYLGIRYDVNYQVMLSVLGLSGKYRLPLVLLDRPNPLTASIMEGPLAIENNLRENARIPWRFGLTLGELALLINEEGWVPTKRGARIYLIPLKNYDRQNWFDQTGLPWSIPLEKVYTIETVLKYCSTCFYKYANISNGIGSLFQYEVGGAPWIGGQVIVERLNDISEAYVEYSRVSFIPGSRSTVLTAAHYLGEECSGIRINIVDRKKYNSSTVGTHLLGVIAQMHTRHFRWKNPGVVDQLFGSDAFRMTVDTGLDIQRLYPVWIAELTDFQKLVVQYLIY